MQVWGSESGGKIDELRLKSDPAVGVHPAFFINLRAHGGSLDFENTKVDIHRAEAGGLPCRLLFGA